MVTDNHFFPAQADNGGVYLSLGAGVQSSTLALMAATGAIGPMPRAAIFADTGDEPRKVYEWLDWLKGQLPFPVITVKAGKLSDFATLVKRSKLSGKTYVHTAVPAYITRTVEGVEKKGIGMRTCTMNFKIAPIRKRLRELANGWNCVQWIGISTDEAHRMKPSRDPWCEHKWPLIEAGMSRGDCMRWMEARGFPKPPRSACVYCPYHSDAEWVRLKTEEPAEFDRAVRFEETMQDSYAKATAFNGVPFLHNSRKPLADVVFQPKRTEPDLFGNECEGMCGV